MNNNFNNPNNQGMQNGGVNNYNSQFGSNVPPQPQQPMMTQPMPGQVPMGQPMSQPTMQQPVNSPVNPQITVPGNTNTNTKKSSKAPVIIIIVVILAIAAGGIVLALSGNSDDKKDSKPNNETNNSAESNNSTNNNTESNNSTNNNSNTQTNNGSDNTNNNNNDSEELIPLNSYANVGDQIELKVNHTYVADEYYFAIRITAKNNGNTDVIFRGAGFETQSFVYFKAHFVPKSIGLANATEDDLIYKTCNLSKIVGSNGVENNIVSTENTILRAGETLEGIVHCTIINVEDRANGVEPALFYTEHYIDSNKSLLTAFDIRNSMTN